VEWGAWVDAKTNISRNLKKEIGRLNGETIGLSTVTDPYQPIEEKLKLSRACLNVLRDAKISLLLMTKSPLVMRDFDLLREMRKKEICVTITTADQKISSVLEPNTPDIESRLRILKKACDNGIKSSVMISPFLVSEDPEGQISELLAMIAETDCRSVLFDRLRLRPTALRRIEKTSAQIQDRSEISFVENVLYQSARIDIVRIISHLRSKKRIPDMSIEIQSS